MNFECSSRSESCTSRTRQFRGGPREVAVSVCAPQLASRLPHSWDVAREEPSDPNGSPTDRTPHGGGAVRSSRGAPTMRERRRFKGEWEYGPTCVDCGGPKAMQHTRCWPCWRDYVLRDDAYWLRRTCPDCLGPKSRQKQRCRPCANERMRGVRRSSPVVVAQGHKWRRMRIGKAAA